MIEYRNEGAVRVIVLAAPERLNALDATMQSELLAALETAGADPACRAIVLTGRGRAFCAGQNLADRDPRRLTAPPDLQASVAQGYNTLIRALRESPVPIVCALNGVAAGAGVGLALSCDIILAAEEARFLLAFSRIGLGPDSGVSWYLTRALGELRVKALMLNGAALDAAEAQAAGLVAAVYPAQALDAAALAQACALADGPSLALALTRRAIHAAATNDLNTQLDLEAELQGQAGRSPDYAEGVLAFLEKRPACFAARGR